MGSSRSKKEGLAPILKVLANSTISADAAKVGIRQAKGSGRDVTELVNKTKEAKDSADNANSNIENYDKYKYVIYGKGYPY